MVGSGVRSRCWFLSEWEGIGNALDVENHGDTGEYPSEWWVLGLKLCHEDEGLTSRLVHVDRAKVDTLLFLALDDLLWLAVDDGHDRELLLGFGLFEATGLVPAGTFDLETEDVGTISVLLLWKVVSLPVHLLLHFGLDVELVQLDGVSSCCNLFDSSQEGLWVIQPVDEGNVWLLSWVLLPAVKLFETLLDVIEP